jgi:hypothetical protein
VLGRLTAYEPQEVDVDGLTYLGGRFAGGFTCGGAGTGIPVRGVCGVTMRGDGVTTVVSQRLREASTA